MELSEIKASPEELEFFEIVPDEILLMFVDSLDAKDLVSLSRTNKRWYNVIQNLIQPKYKKEIDEILTEIYVKHDKSRKIENITPQMMSQIGLMNTNLPLIRESIRKGYKLTPQDLFSVYDYITDSKFEKKVKLLEELLKYFVLDNYYLIYLFDKILSEINKNSKEKTQNLLKMADLLIAKGLCISDLNYFNKFKINTLKDIGNIRVRKQLLDKIQKAICVK